MNRKLSTLLLAFSAIILMLASCKPDLSGLEKRLTDLEGWRAKTEQAIKDANNEVKTLKQLIDALQKKVSVTSYSELADKSGYELVMSDGSKITLRHGSTVEVKADADGTLYWAIGGEFITVNGKKIKAEGKDGAPGTPGKQGEPGTPGAPGTPGTPGVTPLLKVDSDGNWMVSTDAGKTYTQVLTTDGKPIPAKVVEKEKEVLDFKIVEKGGTVTILYKGMEFKFNGQSRTIQPIEYVAEYDLNIDGTGFATDHANTTAGHFNWYQVTGTTEATHNPDGKKLTDAPAFKGYHVPTYYELGIIAPPSQLDADNGSPIVNDNPEKILIAGELKEYTGDYYVGRAMTEVVGIRFKGQGDKYRAAYRYQRVKNPTVTDTTNDQGWYYIITVRPLGPEGTGVGVMDLLKAEYWAANSEKDIVRYFPASGYTEPKNLQRRKSLGDKGYFWSADNHCNIPEAQMDGAQICYDAYAIGYKFFERHLDATWNAYDSREDRYAVRLFRD